MKLYLIYRKEFSGYDAYQEAVVCAETEADARKIHPAGESSREWRDGAWWLGADKNWLDDGWVLIEDVQVQYLGEASSDLQRGIICASLNAG